MKLMHRCCNEQSHVLHVAFSLNILHVREDMSNYPWHPAQNFPMLPGSTRGLHTDPTDLEVQADPGPVVHVVGGVSGKEILATGS